MPKAKKSEPTMTFTIRATPSWVHWLDGLARHARVRSRSDLIEAGAREMARISGYDAPPPRWEMRD